MHVSTPGAVDSGLMNSLRNKGPEAGDLVGGAATVKETTTAGATLPEKFLFVFENEP